MWNPEKAKETQFKTERKEACTAALSLRVPPSLLAKIKEKDNWQEFVRQLLSDNISA